MFGCISILLKGRKDEINKVLSMVAIASLGLTTVSMAEEIKLSEESNER